MNLYLDTSALIKRYVRETGSQEVTALLQQSEIIGTAMVTYVETTATFAKIVRMGLQNQVVVHDKLRIFHRDWRHITQVPVTERLIVLAGDLAWKYQLRGYDAVHLAAAIIWQELLSAPILFATFDKRLWQAARDARLTPFPDNLSSFLAR